MVELQKQPKKILITSALPYVNNVPHLGNLIGCVLSADVYARFQRSAKRDVLYICGTDEHGTTTEAKAREEGVTPQEICDKYFAIHKGVYEWFGISFDYFGRTSAKNHVTRTQEIFHELEKHDLILEKSEQQLYSEQSKMFLSDRYVEGICPHCNYEKARGDQCDNCGKLLNPLDLKNPVSKIDGATPVIKETTHLYLDLEKLQPQLEEWMKEKSKKGSWSENAIKTTSAWFKEGLQARAITRDLSWGVPVLKKGFEGKVFYVWFDAPIGYISITEQLLGESWREWWQKPDDVLLYQFMAKDNIPFHTILFPAAQLGSKIPFTTLHHINSTEYLNYEDIKFSKSNGTGVFGDDAINTGVPADVWRYYLLINRPETADTTFLWSDFQEKLNNELVANLGNFVNRVMTFVSNQCEGTITSVNKEDLAEHNKVFWQKVEAQEQALTNALEEVKLKDALKHVMLLSRMGNQYFQEQAPWAQMKESKKCANETLFVLVNLVKDLSIALEPFLPFSAQNICSQLGIEQKGWDDLGTLSVSGRIKSPALLFTKLEDETLKSMQEKFNGKPGPERLDLRIARIEKVEKHPSADKLYVEHLDCGPLGKKTIVSGLVPYYTAEELTGKHIVLVANLQPAKLRGVISEGMLLAADHKGVVEVLEPKGNPGDSVFLQGITPKPKGLLTIDELFSFGLETKNNTPCIANRPLVTKTAPLTTAIEKGNLK